MAYEVGFKPAALRQLRKLNVDVQILTLPRLKHVGFLVRRSDLLMAGLLQPK